MSENRIYLQPACCADPDVGRIVWVDSDTPYETCEQCECGGWTEYTLSSVAQGRIKELEDAIQTHKGEINEKMKRVLSHHCPEDQQLWKALEGGE